MKAALGLMIELVKEASEAPEVDQIRIRFNYPDQCVMTTKNWRVDAVSLCAYGEAGVAYMDRDDVKAVELIFSASAPAEWQTMSMLHLITALKAANAKRNRSQS